MTTTTDTQVTAAPRFAFTIPAKPFLTALKDVAAIGACTDTTLPALCGVQLEVDEDGTLTFIATDRYLLAVQVVTMDEAHRSAGLEKGEPPVTGSGTLFIPNATVKALSAIKVTGRSYELLTITVSQDGALTIILPDSTVVSYPTTDGYSFPKHQHLMERFEPSDTPETLSYNPAFLARFAKVKGARAVAFTPGKGNVTKFSIGEITGLVIQLKVSA